MFIRSKKVRGRTYYQVVKGERRGGKVRQAVVLSLGECSTLEAARREAEDRMRFYERLLGNSENKATAFATRCANGVKRQEEFLAKLEEVAAEMGLAGVGATTADDVVASEPDEFEEQKARREANRKQAPWKQPDQYIYRRFGTEPIVSWTAHRIQSGVGRFIVFSTLGCRLRDIGTERDPEVQFGPWVGMQVLHALDSLHFSWVDAYEPREGETFFLNCDEVRAAYAKDKAKPAGDEWGQSGSSWRDHTRDFMKGSGPTPADYAVLGLKPGASADEVKGAYRRKAKETHPDRGGSAEAFREVCQAYERISGSAA